MNHLSLKTIIILFFIELAVVAVSVVVGVRIGEQRMTERLAAQREPDAKGNGNSRREITGVANTRDSSRGQPQQPGKVNIVGGNKNGLANSSANTTAEGGKTPPVKDTGSDEADTASLPPQRAVSFSDLPTEYKVIAGGLLVILLTSALYFFVIQPRRKRRLMIEALEIILKDDAANFSRAEELLCEALTKGMRAKDIAETRFALAYVRARMNRFAEAAAALSELLKKAKRDREMIYLDLWIQSRLKSNENVERIYQEHSATLGDMLDAKLIAGIAYLRKARLHWGRREVDGALHYFEELQKLGVLTDEIPSHVDEHEIVIGIMSLFDGNVDEARKHFSAAVATAEEQAKPSTHGRLGLLLCDWRTTENRDIDGALSKELSDIESSYTLVNESASAKCTHCDKKYKVRKDQAGKKLRCTSCKRMFSLALIAPGDDEQGLDDLERLLSDEELLLRNVRLWYAVSLLFTWLCLPARSGLPPKAREEFFRRTSKVKEVDPAIPDAFLLEGLISYYFATSDEEREAAVKEMDKAATNGVNVPEVLYLLDREKRLAELQRDGLNRFFVLVKNYVSDKSRPEDLRRQLKERLERFERFKRMGEMDLVKGEPDLEPSVRDIELGTEILLRRVRDNLEPRLVEADENDRVMIKKLIRRLDSSSKTLSRRVKRQQDTEQKLLVVGGQFWFRDEEPAAEQSAQEDSEQQAEEYVRVFAMLHPPEKNCGMEGGEDHDEGIE
jgi:tetratricopeptide (TPR) repeat protein